MIGRLALATVALSVSMGAAPAQASAPDVSAHPRAARHYLMSLPRGERAAQVKRYARVLPVCATEDSNRCVWRGDVSGNGHGRSFVRLGRIFYLNGGVR